MNENILSLSGSLDSEGASGIEAMFRQAVEAVDASPETCITFDMARVAYLDSAGLRALFQCLRLAREKNIKIGFQNCSANILALLHVTNFDRFCDLDAKQTNEPTPLIT